VPYVAGHFILGIPQEWALFIALGLLAGGSGVIKPNISTMMGETYDQKRPGKDLLRSSAFLWFYFSINVGALLSQLVMPYLRTEYGYALAFQFPAWLMVASLIVFALGKPYYALNIRRDPTPVDWGALARLFGVFGLIVFFWVTYEHNDSLWIYFTRDYANLTIPGLSQPIKADHLQWVNPLFVLVFVPLFNWLFKKLDPEVRIFTQMRKILAGFLLTAVAAGIMSLAGFLVQGHTEQALVSETNPETGAVTQVMQTVSTVKISFLWTVLAYIVLTAGEVLLYGTALELAYTAAPKNMKGMVTAVFLLTNTLGNFVNIFWTPMYGGSLPDPLENRGPLLPGQFFGISALIVVVAAVAFYFVGRRFERGGAANAAEA
jgi:POT family proton-dependent oligopeptide transporter